jgi:hypothetical protein
MKVANWNFTRNNTNFSKELEERMLLEEAQEFKDGMNDLFKAFNNEGSILDSIVEMVDAWADYKFVLQGTQYKYLGCSEPFDMNSKIATENYMFSVLYKDLGIAPRVLKECYEAVIVANSLKGTTKVNGKIQKSKSWKDPKELIAVILLDNVNVQKR